MILRPPLIPQKHLTKPAFAALLERAIKVASARSERSDSNSTADSQKLLFCLKWLIHGRRRPAGASESTPWRDLVEERVNRLYKGFWSYVQRSS